MKIAIVRGPSLNPWEMQNYLPLSKKHRLLLIGSKRGEYKVKSEVRIERLTCLGEVFSFLPGGIKLLYCLFGDPQMILGLEKAISGFDIVHTAEIANYYSFQAIRARQKGQIGKVIVTCWENIAFNRERHPAQKRLKEKVRKGADHFLAVTQGAKKVLIEEGVEEERISVIPMGVDWPHSAKASRGEARGRLRILFVGRLEEEKGIWEALEAFKLLKGAGNDLQLVIVGQGSQEEKIINWLDDNQLGRWVQLKGAVEYEKIWREYRQADIFVLASKPTPTWQEQFGMVLVEAMASGLPIVATKSGAIPEVVGEAGILVEPGNSRKLADAIGRLLKDEKTRRNLGSRGLERAKARYGCRKTAKKIERLYQKILRG